MRRRARSLRTVAGLIALSGLLCGELAASASPEERSPDGRFRARVERNQTLLWEGEQPTPRVLTGYRQGPFLQAVQQRLGGEVDTAVFSADGRTLVVAGTCRGYSGVTEPRKPRCIPGFIQIWDTASGSAQGTLEPYWYLTHDESKVLALALSPDGQSVAALYSVRWSDCSYGGTELHLQVWRRGDGSGPATPSTATPATPPSGGRSLWHREIARGRLAEPGPSALAVTDDGTVTLQRTLGARTRSRVFSPPVQTASRRQRPS